jgi:hypothetical protein
MIRIDWDDPALITPPPPLPRAYRRALLAWLDYWEAIGRVWLPPPAECAILIHRDEADRPLILEVRLASRGVVEGRSWVLDDARVFSPRAIRRRLVRALRQAGRRLFVKHLRDAVAALEAIDEAKARGAEGVTP